MLNLIRLILYLRLEDRQMAVDGRSLQPHWVHNQSSDSPHSILFGWQSSARAPQTDLMYCMGYTAKKSVSVIWLHVMENRDLVFLSICDWISLMICSFRLQRFSLVPCWLSSGGPNFSLIALSTDRQDPQGPQDWQDPHDPQDLQDPQRPQSPQKER